MTPELVRKALVDYLEPRVKALKGCVSEVGDWDEVAERLGQGPAGWSVIVGWDGYDSMEDGDLGDINEISWSAYYFIIERPRGLGAKAGRDIGSLESLVATVIGLVKALRLQDALGNVGSFEFQRSGWDRVAGDKNWRRHTVHARLLTALSAAEPVVVQL